jgi:hypothetical protein
VLNRVRQGQYSAISEIMWAALLIRKGYHLKLEPPSGHGKADTLITTTDGYSVYAEIIAPISANETTEIFEAMKILANQIKPAIPGTRLELHLSEDPRTVEGDDLLSCINSYIANSPSGKIEMSVGTVRWEPYSPHPTWSESISATTDLIQCGVVSFSDDCLADVTADVSDERIQRMVSAKGRQLSRGNRNLVVVNMTTLLASIEQWKTLIQRRLQPNINTRISGVVIMREQFERHEMQIETNFIQNPHALRPIPLSLIEALE